MAETTAGTRPDTHSRFGGLWIDRADWRGQLAARRPSAAQRARVERFATDGYVIVEGAISRRAIDRFQQAIAAAFQHGDPDLLYQAHGSQATRRLDRPVNRLGSRVVDGFVALPQALELFATPVLVNFLRLIFDADPLLFQSLSFDQGSQQGLHQDTAYVVVNRPMELAACWIALQDVQAGSGELMYVPGSHRYPDYDFGWPEKHWPGGEENAPSHADWSRWIVEQAASRQLPTQSFLARKGDILIWHADLAHGGAVVRDTGLTRQSLVGHFCPATARPRYFDHGSRRDTVRAYRGLRYASEHYDLASMPRAGPRFGAAFQRLAAAFGR